MSLHLGIYDGSVNLNTNFSQHIEVRSVLHCVTHCNFYCWHSLIRDRCCLCIAQPDIAAPGVNILAAVPPSGPNKKGAFKFYSGTSMATPHVSGIVALLKSLHSDWSPAAIKSAILTTGTHGSTSFHIFLFVYGFFYFAPCAQAKLDYLPLFIIVRFYPICGNLKEICENGEKYLIF